MAGIREALKKARELEEGNNPDTGSSRRPPSGNRFAYKVYSELLGKEIWLLSDDGMLKEITGDVPAYLTGEIDYLVKHRLTRDEIRKINLVKEIFSGSKIVWN